MKKIMKAVFGYGRPCELNLLRSLASDENGLCRISNYVPHEIAKWSIYK